MCVVITLSGCESLVEGLRFCRCTCLRSASVLCLDGRCNDRGEGRGIYEKNRPYQKIRSVFIEIVSEMRVELTRPHGHYPLKVACLPIPPPGLESAKSSALSEKRGSNPRPRPWQGRALPTELFSHILMFVLRLSGVVFSNAMQSYDLFLN